MSSEFDPAKDAINETKHGVSLAFGAALFGDDNRLELSTFREDDGEHRFKVIAKLDGMHWTAIFVMRSGKRRFISVRRSNNGERKAYDSD